MFLNGYQVDPIPEAPILQTFMANFNVSQEDLVIWRGDSQLRLCCQFYKNKEERELIRFVNKNPIYIVDEADGNQYQDANF